MLSPQHSLILVTAPSASPISLAEAKAQMRVESSDDDALIQRLIDSAVAFVDVNGALGKAMITGAMARPKPNNCFNPDRPVSKPDLDQVL